MRANHKRQHLATKESRFETAEMTAVVPGPGIGTVPDMWAKIAIKLLVLRRVADRYKTGTSRDSLADAIAGARRIQHEANGIPFAVERINAFAAGAAPVAGRGGQRHWLRAG